MGTILIRKGLRGFRYAACGEKGNLLFNANSIGAITAHWSKEKQDGTIRFVRQLDRFPEQETAKSADSPEAAARRVREIRLERGYTQKEAAELIGIPRCAYENIEKGTKSINRTMAIVIAIKMRANTNYILTGEGRKLL
ncbi:MAG: helix-turn-helix domain-containing protein [bacterium]|nr:helix-turn-helix domain-containing protein [bacterium]